MQPKNDHLPLKIDSLQGLRACGFLAIFISHTVDGYESLGAAGVSIFLTLSGFLLAYGYLQREAALLQPSLGGNLRFAFRKIGKLYPLHLFTMLLSICLFLLHPEQYPEASNHLPVKTVLNITLLQAWVPKSAYYYSLNSVSWYRSTAAFTYFMFPWLLSLLRRISKTKSAILAFLAVWIIEIGLSLGVSCFGSDDAAQWFSLRWLTYIFPLFRLLDFTAGALFGFLFLHRKEYSAPSLVQRLFATCAEILLVFSMILLCRLYPSVSQSFRYAVIFILPSVLLIYLLACRTGYISLALSRKPFQIVGALSAFAFLLHHLVIRFFGSWLRTTMPTMKWYVSVMLILTVTILLSAAWDQLQRIIKK